MTLNVNYASQLTTEESFTSDLGNTLPVSDPGGNTTAYLDATTTPPVIKAAAFAKALVAGAATIDLAALTTFTGAAVNGTGLKVQAIKILNPSTNSNPLVVQPGAANGYSLFGASSKVQINPGEELCWKGFDKAAVPDIDGTHKTLDLTDGGAGGTESYQFKIVMG